MGSKQDTNRPFSLFPLDRWLRFGLRVDRFTFPGPCEDAHRHAGLLERAAADGNDLRRQLRAVLRPLPLQPPQPRAAQEAP